MAGVEASMSHVRMPAVLTAVTVALGLLSAVPARAEFFGCNDRPGQVLHESGARYSGGSYRQTTRYTHDFAAQPRRISHQRVSYSSGGRYYGSQYR
jgi:hypothetical protein